MADLPQEGDELKKAYLEKALHANDAASLQSTVSDLFNKDSGIYQRPEMTEEEKERKKEEKKKNAPAPKPTVDADGYPIIDNVRTYKEDLEGIINKDKLSLERIAMMQDTANRAAPKIEEPEKKQNRTFLVIGIVLLILGSALVFAVFIFRRNAAAPAQEQAQKERYIIFAESNVEANITRLTKTEIKAFMQRSVDAFRDQDSVKEIVPTLDSDLGKSRAKISDLFAKTNAILPDDLARSLYDKFFLGLYSSAGKTDPFMIFYTNSYDIAYPAMLRWEGIMETDLNWMFNTEQTVGSTTSALAFKDRVVANTDARSYEDPSGKVAFFYTFLDQNTILFARSTETVRMVQDRLRQAKFQ